MEYEPIDVNYFIDMKENNVVINLLRRKNSFNENFLNAIRRYNPTLEYADEDANTLNSFSTRPQSE
ncbi:32355_t:CDS:1, partial [Racocetra persica]